MEPFLGQIQLFAFGYAPEGWIPCEGQTLSIHQNAALYTLIGNTFGGDGQRTFAVPDLRTANPLDPRGHAYMAYHIALQGIYPIRN